MTATLVAPAPSKEAYAAGLRGELERFVAEGERLAFEQPEWPRVSVVVVTWNRAELVLACLRSVRDHGIPGSTELVVLDNASTDETAVLVGRLDGATVIRNEANDGFLLGANRAAAVARGRTIVFVNSDAVLQPGALEAMARLIERDRTVGVVGGRLIDVRGVLQEAGGVVFSDGSVRSIGAGDDPDAAPYAFRRDVDYCTGALLAIDSDLWRSLRGFDERYVPAYYEDADLCLRAKAAGRRVVYEPAATAVHVGFASGTDLSAATRLAERNRQRLVDAHRDALALHALPPQPLSRLSVPVSGTVSLESGGALVVGVPRYLTAIPAATGHGRVWGRVLDGLGRRVEVRELDPADAGQASVWVADGYQGAPPIAAGVPCVVEIHEAAWDDPSTRDTVDPTFAANLDGRARDAVARAAHVITLSESSKRQIVQRYGADHDRVHAIHLGVDTATFRPGLAGGAEIVERSGGSGAPYVACVATAHPRKNLDALRDAMAVLAARGLPHQLALVVSEVRDDPRKDEYLRDVVRDIPGHPGLLVRVACPTDDDLAAVLAGAAAFCLPSLMEGFGLPALEAMACGTPVVVSNRGSLPEVVGDAGLLVEPSAAAIADGLARVLTDHDLARRLGREGRARAESSFSWALTVARWEDVLRRAADTTTPHQPQQLTEGTSVGPSIYHRAVDPDAPNNAHSYLVSMVGFNKRVLELGCAGGHVTEALVARGCTVVGVEVDAEAAEGARKHAERVVVGDVETLGEDELGRDFDVITFGDVLEHLKDPLGVLRRLTRLLAPGGFVVVSLPNVVHADVRLRMWRGDFPYAPIGLLDHTHLRFFTNTTMREMFTEAGLLVTEVRRIVVPVFGTELAPSREGVPAALLEEMLRDPEAETYQFVVTAVPDSGDAAVSKAMDRLAELEEFSRNEDIREMRLRSEMDDVRREAAGVAREAADAAERARLDAVEARRERDEFETQLRTLDAEYQRLAAHTAAVEAELDKAGEYARWLESQVERAERGEAAAKAAPPPPATARLRRLVRRLLDVAKGS